MPIYSSSWVYCSLEGMMLFLFLVLFGVILEVWLSQHLPLAPLNVKIVFLLTLFFLLDFQCKLNDMHWNHNNQHCYSFSHVLVPCYQGIFQPAVLTPLLNVFWQTPGGSVFSQSNPFHRWNLSLGSWEVVPLIPLPWCWEQVEYTCSSTCTRLHASMGMVRGWRNTSFPFTEGIDIVQRERKKLSLVVLCRLPI